MIDLQQANFKIRRIHLNYGAVNVIKDTLSPLLHHPFLFLPFPLSFPLCPFLSSSLPNTSSHRYSIILISKMLRESAWKKQQSLLQQDATNLSILKKEINKQSQIDASVQLSISEKIETLKQNATTLAKKLENEKHKNIQLETIISHLRGIIEKEKIEEASFRDSNNFQSLTGLENRYKKLEYDLGQLNGKTNRIAENVDEKKIKINQNRTERVIDSGIFRNIEKQLIESELKFKKLLIEKIKYQKEYEKLLNNYEGLKAHAESYGEQKEKGSKAGASDNSLPLGESKGSGVKKFTNLEVGGNGREGGNNKPRSMTQLEEENEYQQQKQMMVIKKLLSQTRLDGCQELLHNFFHIDEINDRYFNEMTLFTDQSNEIEKYLSEFSHLRADNRLRFYETKKAPTKNEALKSEAGRIRQLISQVAQETTQQMEEITNFFKQSNFKLFSQSFGLKEYPLRQGAHFDDLKDILQDLESSMNQILSHPQTMKEQKVTTSRSNQHQKLQQLINRVRKSQENLKVMKKEQFQEQYHKILKSSASKSSLLKHQTRRPSNGANPANPIKK